MVQEKKSLTKKPSRPNKTRQTMPASDPENREKQLINKAVALAEKQLEDGTASAAVITHYLKLATSRENLEREILKEQAAMIKAKTSSIAQAQDNENLAKEAIAAMKSYGPSQ